MATIGNNISAKNADLRDAFLDSKSEREHLNSLLSEINKDKKVEGLMQKSTTRSAVYNKLIGRIPNETSEKDRKILTYLMLNTEFDKSVLPIIYNFDSNIKRIYCESIIDCVDEGLFNDETMELAENQLALVLSSIEDLQRIREKEIVPDFEPEL